ncbi:MAG: outer membrane lipoprotein-sorting protein [Bacteroidales bacterium]|nr:outer membrane lipoprotein-sorting protein [Bacteroidales bacterium]
MKVLRFLMLGIFLVLLQSVGAQDMTAKEILQQAEDQWQGEESSQGDMTMKIIRAEWERTIEMKMWIKGRLFSLTLITAPANERGQTFLKRDDNMWHWMPSINRMIKIPPSMMSQGWMGSDYTNNDILKESSIVVDYHHSIIGEETINDHNCWKLKLVPKEDAAVVWGKVIKYIDKQHFMQLKSEYYNEDDELIRTEKASDIEMMDGRKIPTKIEIIPQNEAGKKTVIMVDNMKFNKDIPDGFFSQQNMKRVK